MEYNLYEKRIFLVATASTPSDDTVNGGTPSLQQRQSMKEAKFGISLGMGFKMSVDEQIETIGRVG